MASQEFLASFAVDIDEAGVSRLQQVLEENRDLAGEVAAAFEAATSAIQEYQKAALGGDNLPGKETGTTGAGRVLRPVLQKAAGILAARIIRKRLPGTWRTGSTGARVIRERSRAC